MVREDVADVWTVALPPGDSFDGQAWALLSGDEQARAQRFHRTIDRHRYTSAHAALRVLLALQLHSAPDELRILPSASGKPHLEARPIRFNLSYAGTQAVVGISPTSEIGVDTEPIAGPPDYVGTARARFSRAEVDWIEEAVEPERLRRFCRLWAIREALVKATGQGLSLPMHEIDVEIVDGTPRLALDGPWWAHEAPVLDRYATAVVIERGVEARWHTTSWRELADLAQKR